MKNECNCNVNATVFKWPKIGEAAYILGVLWADGYIRSAGHGRWVVLEIMNKDATQLKPIFARTGKWHFDTRRRPKRKPISRFMATNRYLFDYLHSLNYEAKSEKSAAKVLLSIPESLRPYWWRGYFDGDGCIYAKGKNVQVSISSSYNQEWDFAENLMEQLGISFSIKRRSHKSKKGKMSYSSYIRFTGKNNVHKFYDYIYSSKLKTFGLLRKLKKFISVYGKDKLLPGSSLAA
jgi:hypothetical protein